MAHTTVAIDPRDLEFLKAIAEDDKRTIKTSLGILIENEYRRRNVVRTLPINHGVESYV